MQKHSFDPWVGKFPGKGNDNPLQYSCLENSVDRGVWWAIVHKVTKELDVTEYSLTRVLILCDCFQGSRLLIMILPDLQFHLFNVGLLRALC